MSSSVETATSPDEENSAPINEAVAASSNKVSEPIMISVGNNRDKREKKYGLNFEEEEMEITKKDIELLAHGKHILTIPKFLGFMRFERLRLASFLGIGRAWPLIQDISPVALAKNGFYYLSGDFVQCAFCMVILSNWRKSKCF